MPSNLLCCSEKSKSSNRNIMFGMTQHVKERMLDAAYSEHADSCPGLY
jgi:hypothetical protein